jgi:hypothetical protein
LLFRGKNYLHKGLPVTKGTRNLLVFWSELWKGDGDGYTRYAPCAFRLL